MAGDLPPFILERYFAKYEFTVKYQLSTSDGEALSMSEVLAMADEECKALWEKLLLSYTETAGHPLLLKEITQLYTSVKPENIMVIAPQEGIYLAMKAIAMHLQKDLNIENPHVVTTFPAYQSLYEDINSFGCEVSHWTATLGQNGWKFDLDDLRTQLKPNTKALIVNFPHNPTGYCPDREGFDQIVALCKERDLFLFSDEMYWLVRMDGKESNPAAVDVYDKAVSLYGMSKTLGMPGIRLGWVATKYQRIMELIAQYKDYMTICPPAPSEILAIIGLRNKERIVQRLKDICTTNVAACEKFFQEYPDLFDWYPPCGGTIGFFRVKGKLLKLGKGGALGFADDVREKVQIALLPGKMYDFTDEYCRLGFGRANVPEILQLLRSYLKSIA